MGIKVIEALEKGWNRVFTMDGILLTLLFTISYLAMEIIYRALRISNYDSTQYVTVDPSGTYLLPGGVLTENIAGFASIELVALCFFLPVIPTFLGFRKLNGKSMMPGSWGKAAKTILVLILANLVVVLGIVFGSLFFFLPGVYIALSLIFFPILVCAYDQGFGALRESWKLTKGVKIELFALVVVLTFVTAIFSVLTQFYGLDFTSVLMTGFESVLGIAVISEAFKQAMRGETE